MRVSHAEFAALRAKALLMDMTPAQWLRERRSAVACHRRRLRRSTTEEYAELARLAANLNQRTRMANEGERVSVAIGLLSKLRSEVGRLRLELSRRDRGGRE